MMDTTKVGTEAARLMELLAEDPEISEDAEIGVVAVIVETSAPVTAEEFEEHYGYPPEADEDLRRTDIRWRCSDGRGWVQRGLFQEAADG